MSVELDEKFDIKFAQFEQRQKEMDRNTMKTINVRTDTSKRKIVIRTPPEDAAQCFDVACENATAKMGYTIGLISPCLYLHKTENVADDVAKSRSVYDTMIKVFLDARSPSKGMQHHVVMNGCTQTVPGFFFSDGQNVEYAHTMQYCAKTLLSRSSIPWSKECQQDLGRARSIFGQTIAEYQKECIFLDYAERKLEDRRFS